MILDTNAVSAAADGETELEPLLRGTRLLALPVIVIGEFQYGIRQSRHREQYQSWFAVLVASCTVLPVDQETAERYTTCGSRRWPVSTTCPCSAAIVTSMRSKT